MARYVFQKKDQVAGGRAAGTKSFLEGTGFHAISGDARRMNSRKGGLKQGPIQGAANVASGQIERIRIESEEARLRWARSDENRAAMREIGSIQGPKVDFSKIKTPESLRLGGLVGGPIGRHVRWHVNRGILNLKCDLCLASLEKNWGIPVLDNEFSN